MLKKKALLRAQIRATRREWQKEFEKNEKIAKARQRVEAKKRKEGKIKRKRKN